MPQAETGDGGALFAVSLRHSRACTGSKGFCYPLLAFHETYYSKHSIDSSR